MKASRIVGFILLIGITSALTVQEVTLASSDEETIASGFRGVTWGDQLPVTYTDPSSSIPAGTFPAFDLPSIPEEGRGLFAPMDRMLFDPWTGTLGEMSFLTFDLEGHLEAHLKSIFPYYFDDINQIHQRHPDMSEDLASDWAKFLSERYPSWVVDEISLGFKQYGINVKSIRAIVPWTEQTIELEGMPMFYDESLLRLRNTMASTNIFWEEYEKETLERDRLIKQIEPSVMAMTSKYLEMSNEERFANVVALKTSWENNAEAFYINGSMTPEEHRDFCRDFCLLRNLSDIISLTERTEDSDQDILQNWESQSVSSYLDDLVGRILNPENESEWSPTYIKADRFVFLEEKPAINHRLVGGINPAIVGTPLEAQADPTIRVIPPPTYLVAGNNDNASSYRALVVTTGNFGDLGEGSLLYSVSWDLMPPLEIPVSDSELEPGESDETQMLYFMEADMGSQNFKPSGIKQTMDELLGTVDVNEAVELQSTGYPIGWIHEIAQFYPLTWKVHPERIADDSSFLRQWISSDAKLGRTTRMWTTGENHELICAVDNFGDADDYWIDRNHFAHKAIKKLVTDAAEELGEPLIKDWIATPYIRSKTRVGREVGERMGWMKGTGLVWNHPTGNLMIKTMGNIDLKEPDTGPLHATAKFNDLEYTVRDTGTIQVLVDKSAPQGGQRRDANGIFVWANLRVANPSVDTPVSLGAKPVLINQSIDRTYTALPDESKYLVGMKDIYAGIMADELEDRTKAQGWSQTEIRDLVLKDGIGHEQLNLIEPEASRDFWILFEVPQSAMDKSVQLDLVLDGGDGPAIPLIGLNKHQLVSRKMAGQFEIFGMKIIDRKPLAREFNNLDLDSMSGNIQIWRSSPKMQEALDAAIANREAKADEARRKAAEQETLERKQVEESLGDL